MKEESIKESHTSDHKDNSTEKIADRAEPEVSESKENTEESVDTEQSELEKLTQDLGEAKDKHLRLYSEFENFRRRTAKERLELIGSANAELVIALLPILDDFERAREAAADNSELKTEQEGVNLIYQKLLKELKGRGLKPMEDLEGKRFDAEVHEAISQIPAEKKKLKNKIVHVIEKGYYLNDKVIRYAKVVIGT